MWTAAMISPTMLSALFIAHTWRKSFTAGIAAFAARAVLGGAGAGLSRRRRAARRGSRFSQVRVGARGAAIERSLNGSGGRERVVREPEHRRGAGGIGAVPERVDQRGHEDQPAGHEHELGELDCNGDGESGELGGGSVERV